VPMNLAPTPEANALLERDPPALLLGMALDQQIPMEKAFAGPAELAARLGKAPGEPLDAAEIAAHPPEAFAALFARPPAIHRFPGSMAGRVQQVCRALVERYDGDATAIWRDVPDGAELRRRLEALPGFGAQKAKIFTALLGKQVGVAPPGWREAAGEYGEDGARRSVADVVDAATLAEVRAHKQPVKAAAKAAKAARAGAAADGGEA
jgi:uncharacterized HhH-GPD family protein